MDKFDIQIKHNNTHFIGYAVVQKSECEIFNYVSPDFRILRFLDGVVEWKVGKDFYIFYPGDVVIFNNLSKRNIHKVLTGLVTYEFFDFLPSCISNETLRNFFYAQIHKVVSKNDAIAEKIYFLMNGLKSEMENQGDPFQKMSIEWHLDLLTLVFYRNIKVQKLHTNTALDSIAKCIQYIRDHLSEEIKITQLAANCGYSNEYFSRAFKKYMGVSPDFYIINLRLENVIHLMSTTNMTIQSAAYQSGFQSPSTFYKAFKAYKQTSPTKYLEGISVSDDAEPRQPVQVQPQ
jgi:AraC family transcriptional regulator of adaptative response / methylphosphotriester-DNA alkyltransferase methyltransferase